MNLILFDPAELERPLSRSDRRAAHVLDVLRRRPGDTFDAGVINGPRGKATLTAIDSDTIAFRFQPGPPPSPPPELVTLLIGLPRPQTARDILRDATTLGVAALHFIRTEKSEPSYAQSTLWSSGEWRRHVIAGAEQAFDTRLPVVTHGRTLRETLGELAPEPAALRFALDNYESPAPLGACMLAPDAPLALAIGSERGWSAAERTLLREQGFAFVHLGARVLRTESAVVATLAIVRAKLGLM